MKKLLFLPFVSLLFCLACTRDIVLKLDGPSSMLVLNASITPGQEVGAFLSKSWFLLDSVPEYALPDEEVEIRVYVNDLFRGVMRHSDNPADTVEYKGQYKLPDCLVKAGDRVRLEAEASGFTSVSGETLIPALTEIVAVDTSSILTSDYYSTRLRTYVTLKDNPSERNYYRLVVERVVEYHKDDLVEWESSFCDSWGEPSSVSGDSFMESSSFSSFLLAYEDPVFQPGVPALEDYDGNYCRGVFTDDMFNGKEYTVTTSFFPDFSYQTDSISAIVHYDLHLMSISEAYYNYLKMIRSFSISLGDAYLDGLLEPTATYSNVTDGFGVVTGYQISTRRITMPFGDPPHEWEW